MSSGRLEAVGDAVIAVEITIRVLNLHLPRGSSLHDLRPLVPKLSGLPPQLSAADQSMKATTYEVKASHVPMRKVVVYRGRPHRHHVWSVYGAKRAQPVATGRKWDSRANGSNKPKPLPLVATSCRSERMVGVHSLRVMEGVAFLAPQREIEP
jgi:hypothetical protein